MTGKIRKKSFHILTILIVSVIIVLSLIVNYAIVAINNSAEKLKVNTETSYRSYIREELVHYGSSVEAQICYLTKDGKTDDVPSSIFTDNLSDIAYSPAIRDIVVLNLGYDEVTNAYEIDTEKLCKDYPDISSDRIKEQMDLLFNSIKSNKLSTQTFDLTDMINNMVTDLTNGTTVNKYALKKDIYDILFKSNNIVIQTSKMTLDTANNNFYNLKDTDDYWVEWISIPKGYLGLNKEPNIINGMMNTKYKKYVVMVIIDKSVVLSNYNSFINKANCVESFLVSFTVITTFLAIILCTIQFYKLIRGGGDIEPIVNGKNTNHNGNDFEQLLSRILDRIKSLCHR